MTSPSAIQTPVLQSLKEIYRFAIANALPIAIYRMPGDKEPVTILQTSQQLNILKDGLDAIGKEGFVMSPWKNQSSSPVIFIKADHVWNGWQPETGDIVINTNGVVQALEATHYPVFETSFELYQQQVTAIKLAIEKGIIEKAILSRVLFDNLPETFDPINTFKKATDEYPDAFCYLVNIPGRGQWMGASPEVLANVEGRKITTVALAGTKQNTGQQPENISWGEKELHEQQLVSRHILQCLQQFCFDVEAWGPHTVKAGNLFHLRTDFRADLPVNNASGTLKSLLHKMHPTPAIAGSPKEAAIKLINEVEQHERVYYAGFVGPVKADGSLKCFVNLRCMQIMLDKALLYVGGGITAGSDAELEWKETEAKAGTLLNIIC